MLSTKSPSYRNVCVSFRLERFHSSTLGRRAPSNYYAVDIFFGPPYRIVWLDWLSPSNNYRIVIGAPRRRARKDETDGSKRASKDWIVTDEERPMIVPLVAVVGLLDVHEGNPASSNNECSRRSRPRALSRFVDVLDEAPCLCKHPRGM